MSAPTIAQILAILGEVDHAALLDDIALHLPGPRTANLEPTRGSGNTDAGEPTRDEKRAMEHQALIDAAIVRAYTAVLAIANVQRVRLPRHQPRRTTLIAETKGCTWCQQAGITEHQPVWRTSDCGFLTHPVPLGRPCYEYAMAHGERPSNEQIIRHHRTGKWTQRINPKARNFSVEQVADWKPGGTAA